MVAANGARTQSDTTWTNPSNYYSIGDNSGTDQATTTNVTLTATRTIAALRNVGNNARATMDGRSLACQTKAEGGLVVVQFKEPITVEAGKTLLVEG